ncbi:MAG: hypothetical protein A2Y63_05560 [Candidatus Riflebacteria bacterium RBG_13_59_9]|nr:MAG: hypothetical protein A2Y63_05560 [Candidatus Riflebacteria bacterium RBG_13_59_9]
MKVLCELTVSENRRLNDDTWLMALAVPPEAADVLSEVRAGRFVMLRCAESGDLHFRRPFSFASVDRLAGTFTLCYKVVGDQTRALSACTRGEKLSGLLPLGNTFTLPTEKVPLVLVAGGVGVVPLLLLAKELAPREHEPPQLYLGGGTVSDLMLDHVGGFPVRMRVATEDGSHGFQGTVVEMLASDRLPPDAHVYACGPKPMLQALLAALPENVPVEASLEEVMACGIGACYGCAVRTDGLGMDAVKLVCRDGPVFNLRRLRFD